MVSIADRRGESCIPSGDASLLGEGNATQKYVLHNQSVVGTKEEGRKNFSVATPILLWFYLDSRRCEGVVGRIKE